VPIHHTSLNSVQKDSSNVPPSTIRAAAHAVAVREIASQKEQFRQFGIMADWDNNASTYRTLDHSYEMRQLRIFEQIVNNGLIHRRYRPVHYSPSSRSALAEAELVYMENHVSHSVYVTFVLDHPSVELVLKTTNIASFDPIQLLVWTTTPWTLAANMGIAVHSDMVYTLLRRMTDSSLTLIAQSRLKALLDILGP
ncbi:MAG: Aminoacyl-tRNA synthetase, partial [Lentinula lateritia]